jgi:hypothetical protein
MNESKLKVNWRLLAAANDRHALVQVMRPRLPALAQAGASLDSLAGKVVRRLTPIEYGVRGDCQSLNQQLWIS